MNFLPQPAFARWFARCCWLGFLAVLCCGQAWTVRAQELDLESLSSAAEQWARENLDEELVAAVDKGDPESLRKALDKLQKDFGGEYVLDLAELKQTAQTILPLLENFEETASYAQWLRTRLDYFEVAEQLRVKPPKLEPGVRVVLENPPASRQRDIWVQKLSERPWPEKARELVPRLKPLFQAEQVAPELVWIAEVESSFDAKARSPAGAVGLFQLMPATAKRFGVKTAPVDGRKHPGDSARASAKYLKFLYEKFKDWRLAIAAYNCGEGTVQKLLQKHKARTFDEIAPHLPAETQMYVPKVEATLVRREGIRFAELRMPSKAEQRTPPKAG